MMGRRTNATALAHRITIYPSEDPKINQDVQEDFPSVVSGMNMVILKQHALNGLC
jgi:hypothetical protein